MAVPSPLSTMYVIASIAIALRLAGSSSSREAFSSGLSLGSSHVAVVALGAGVEDLVEVAIDVAVRILTANVKGGI